MKVGAIFPQDNISSDPVAIRDFVQGVEDMGFEHLLFYDHVLGINPELRNNWSGLYTHEALFHEPMVLMGFVAAATNRIKLVTGVVVLPQRQTALVAKQAAEVDVLSGGRLRLGIGVGWNSAEYESLNEDFSNRGRRCEEQIELLRRLWTSPTVTYEGQWHRIYGAGINPLPVQQPIPIWIGGKADATLRRVARIGDGWIILGPPNVTARDMMQRLRKYMQEAHRCWDQLGVQAGMHVGKVPQRDWRNFVRKWQALGATHFDINTRRMGLQTVDAHLQVLRRVKTALEG